MPSNQDDPFLDFETYRALDSTDLKARFELYWAAALDQLKARLEGQEPMTNCDCESDDLAGQNEAWWKPAGRKRQGRP